MTVSTINSSLRSIHAALNAAFFSPIIYILLASLGVIITTWENADKLQDAQINPNPRSEETFDFIIVGAGSAGGLVANRLSRYYNVLLLEAGGEPNPLQLIPGYGVFLINYPETDWQHKTVPQKKASLNSVDQRSSWSAGKVLGGTGTINLMVHLRGHPKDFDTWANITGDPSWSHEGVLPDFKSYENYQVPGVDEKYHGFSGDLHITTPSFTGITKEFIEAHNELGIPHTDLNAPYDSGVDYIHYPMKNGLRQASFKAFIQPARNRRTLVIRKYSFVHKVILDGNDNVAVGVEYERGGKMLKAFVTREVILCAGAINTPKILMLSGIGPKDHLEEFHIKVRKNLPVGKNLQDHLAVYLGPVYLNNPRQEPRSTIVLERDLTPKSFLEWFAFGRGVLTNSGATSTSIFTSSYAKARGEDNWPDIQLYTYGFSIFKTFPEVAARAFGLKLDELQEYSTNAYGRESTIMLITGARPKSKGDIKLGGPSPYDNLVIDPKYLEDEDDVDFKVLKEALDFTLNMIQNTTAFRRLGAEVTKDKIPGCQHLKYGQDPYWECYIRRFSVTNHHASGTCAMGKKDSPDAVVDSQLKVLGTKGLRVIDASVMPVIPVSNTQAPTLMVAEKGAKMIIKLWKGYDKENELTGNAIPQWKK